MARTHFGSQQPLRRQFQAGGDQARWWQTAACQQPGTDPDMWWTKTAYPSAIHQCLSHCPVLGRCRAFATQHPWFDCVIAGQVWVRGHGTDGAGVRAARQPPATSRHCSTCRGPAAEPIHPKPAAEPLRGRQYRPPAPCGTVVAYQRHKSHGEPVDEACAHARRLYDRQRYRDRLAAEVT